MVCLRGVIFRVNWYRRGQPTAGTISVCYPSMTPRVCQQRPSSISFVSKFFLIIFPKFPKGWTITWKHEPTKTLRPLNFFFCQECFITAKKLKKQASKIVTEQLLSPSPESSLWRQFLSSREILHPNIPLNTAPNDRTYCPTPVP